MGVYSEKLRIVLDENLSDLPVAAPVFGTRIWLEATRKALPFPLKVLKVYKDGVFAAYLPLQFIRRGGLVKSFVPILTFYGGPYFTLEPRRYFNEETRERYEILVAILEYLDGNSHYSLLLPEEFDARAALDKGWKCTPTYTVVNLIDSEGSLDVNPACARNIRKAEKLGLVFGVTRGDGAFEEAFARTFARKGLSMRWKPEWAAALRRELEGSGIMENYSVRNAEGKEIAYASIALDRFRKSAIQWYSCSLAEADQTGAMHFLNYSLLRRYRGEYETFDLCGANHRSLAEFKEKFAQKLVGRFMLERYRGPVSKALLRSYAWANGLRS